MNNILLFNRQRTRLKPAILQADVKPVEGNLHIKEGEYYDVEELATGIEIALLILFDPDAAQFLLRKIIQAVNQGDIDIFLDLSERRKYLDLIDIVNSELNSGYRMKVNSLKFE